MTPFQKITIDAVSRAVFAVYQTKARESIADWSLITPKARGQWRDAVIQVTALVLDSGERDPEVLAQVMFRIWSRIPGSVPRYTWGQMPDLHRENWTGAARYLIEVLSLP